MLELNRNLGTVSYGLHLAPQASGDNNAEKVAFSLLDAATREGIILHSHDVLGVNRSLLADEALGDADFIEMVHSAIRAQVGIALQVVLYPAQGAAQPVYTLCSLMSEGDPDTCAVLIQHYPGKIA